MKPTSVLVPPVRKLVAAAAADDGPTEHVSGCLLSGLAAVLMFFGAMTHSPLALGIGAMLVGVLVFSRLAQDVRGGVTSSNWGTWSREATPRSFHRNVGFWAAIAIGWCLFGLLIAFEVIRFPAQ
jgi:hypothetical protein